MKGNFHLPAFNNTSLSVGLILKRSLPFILVLISSFVVLGQHIDSSIFYAPKLMPAKGHTDRVIFAEFSPNGKQVVTACEDGTAKIWDARTGKLLIDLNEHTQAIYSAHYSPDGNLIVTSSYDKTAKIWDASNGKLLHNLIGHKDLVKSAFFSPDGDQIVTSSYDKTARLWDANNGELLHELIGHTESLSTAQFSPNGKYIATGGQDGTAKIWDVRNGNLLHNLIGHSLTVMSVNFSPDGKQLLTGSYDNSAKVWDVITGGLILNLTGHAGWVSSAQFSYDGKQILTESWDKTAKIWDAKTGKVLFELKGHTAAIRSACYSPSGNQIVTTSFDNTAKVWDARNGNLLYNLIGHSGYMESARFSPDGMKIVTASNDKTAKVWDATTGKCLNDLKGYIAIVTAAQFSPDGKEILTASKDKTVKVWDAIDGKLIQNLTDHSGYINAVQYSPNQSQILAVCSDKVVKVWDGNSGQLALNHTGHTGSVNSGEYNSEGDQIVTSSNDKTAKVWDLKNGLLLHDLRGHTDIVYSAQYSSDGQRILTASQDKTAKVWDTKTGQLLHDLTGHTSIVYFAVFSPDNKQIVTVSADKTAKIWDANTGLVLYNLTGYGDYVIHADYSPDGKQVITTGNDKTVKVWSAENGQLLFELKEKEDSANNTLNTFSKPSGIIHAQYSPSGEQIVTASENKNAKIWDAQSGKNLYTFECHAAVLNAQYNPGGTIIMLRLSDGALTFLHVGSYKQLLTFYPLSNSNWVVLHPSGLFDASPGAMKWMYYLIGQEVIELEQLKERYYEPGLFKKAIASSQVELRDVEQFEMLNMYPLVEVGIQNDILNIQLQPRNGGIGKVSLFINNKEVLADANPKRESSLLINLLQFEKYFRFDKTDIIGIRTYNKEGWLKSPNVIFDYKAEFVGNKGTRVDQLDINFQKETPNFYAVIVGTSDYSGNQLDLRYADKDASDMYNAINQTSKLLFGNQHVYIEFFSTDNNSGSKKASKDNIKSAFTTIAEVAKPEDVLFIYLSGHGVTPNGLEKEQFYYLTKDIVSGDLSDPAIRNSYAISTEEFTQWINGIAAQKQVLILDACSSGKAAEDLLSVREVPTSQVRALDRMKDRTGMFVLAGSAADKVSYEASQFGQGLLTYSLLLGISGAALREGKNVDVMQLFQYARDKVPEFANYIGGIQEPILAFPTNAGSFDIGIKTDDIEIPLEEIKPLFTRSNFQEVNSFKDEIGLSKAVDENLLHSSIGLVNSRGFIFVDVPECDNAYSIYGRYSMEKDKVNIEGRLFKNKDMIGIIEVKGNSKQLDTVVNDILKKVSELIDH